MQTTSPATARPEHRKLRRAVGHLLQRLGYELRRVRTPSTTTARFILHSYIGEDGKFDYERYRRVQTAGNHSKLASVWVNEENVAFLSNYLRQYLCKPQFGICHGTRRGKEQQWFSEQLGCSVIGTEISDTAEQFPNTIRWDFHEVKPEWIGKTDFVYSNSFDHSYDPEKCLNAWMSCIRPGGVCILEHSSLHGPNGATELDPFGADLVFMPYLVALWGKGAYAVREILPAPQKRENLSYLNFLIIHKF